MMVTLSSRRVSDPLFLWTVPQPATVQWIPGLMSSGVLGSGMGFILNLILRLVWIWRNHKKPRERVGAYKEQSVIDFGVWQATLDFLIYSTSNRYRSLSCSWFLGDSVPIDTGFQACRLLYLWRNPTKQTGRISVLSFHTIPMWVRLRAGIETEAAHLQNPVLKPW